MEHIIWSVNDDEIADKACELMNTAVGQVKDVLAGFTGLSEIDSETTRDIVDAAIVEAYKTILADDFSERPYPNDKRIEFVLDMARNSIIDDAFVEEYGSLVDEDILQETLDSVSDWESEYRFEAENYFEDLKDDAVEKLKNIKFAPSMMMVRDEGPNSWHIIDDDSRGTSTSWGYGRYTDLGEAFSRLCRYGTQTITPDKSFYIDDDGTNSLSGNLVFETDLGNELQIVFVPQNIYDEACNSSYDERYVQFQSTDDLAVHLAKSRDRLINVCDAVRKLYGWSTVENEFGHESVRDWYLENFPDDTLGAELDGTVSFRQVLHVAALNGDQVYDVLGVGDSVIRERVFAKCNELFGCDTYNLWMEDDMDVARESLGAVLMVPSTDNLEERCDEVSTVTPKLDEYEMAVEDSKDRPTR